MPSPEALDVRVALAAMARELYAQGLFTAMGGNLSARVPGLECAWITPTGVYKGGLVTEDMVRIDLHARVLGGPPGLSPSLEAGVHAAVYRARPDAMAVIHAHAPSATVLATLALDLPPVTEEALPYTSLPRLPFRPSGSEELATAIAKSLGQSDLVLVANHGVFACGPNLRAVANHLLSLEAACRLFLMLRLHGEGLVPVIEDR